MSCVGDFGSASIGQRAVKRYDVYITWLKKDHRCRRRTQWRWIHVCYVKKSRRSLYVRWISCRTSNDERVAFCCVTGFCGIVAAPSDDETNLSPNATTIAAILMGCSCRCTGAAPLRASAPRICSCSWSFRYTRYVCACAISTLECSSESTGAICRVERRCESQTTTRRFPFRGDCRCRRLDWSDWTGGRWWPVVVGERIRGRAREEPSESARSTPRRAENSASNLWPEKTHTSTAKLNSLHLLLSIPSVCVCMCVRYIYRRWNLLTA